MQYNVENLFDPYHDPEKHDEEFTPEGKARWTMESLEWKMRNLAKVISSVSNPNGSACPDVLVLEEIENPTVAKLFKDFALTDCNYKKIIIDAKSPDIRGIRVAIMTKLEQASPAISHPTYSGGRKIIEAPLTVGGNRLVVFANHWKSRITRPPDTDGGKEKRELAARVVRKRVEQILETEPKTDIVVAGDLNDEPEDSSIAKVLGVRGGLLPVQEEESLFWEPSFELKQSPLLQTFDEQDQDIVFRKLRGTYFYKNKFYQLDHIFVSNTLFDDEGLTYQRGSFKVVRVPPFVIPVSQAPLSFKNIIDDSGNDRGPKGASDHFPILIRLEYQNQSN